MQLTTADRLLAMPDDGWCYELVRGELRRMTPAGEQHGFLAMRIGARLAMHVDERRLGRVYAAETGFLLASDPDTVLAPDVAFVRRERLSGRTGRGFPKGPPDLAVEVRSPGDSRHDLRAKAEAWLAHGCLQVWTVDAEARTVTVHRAGAGPELLREADTLTGGDLLAGFTLPLGELFAD